MRISAEVRTGLKLGVTIREGSYKRQSLPSPPPHHSNVYVQEDRLQEARHQLLRVH